MFCALHGTGPLLELAHRFSPVVEQTAADIVTFDVSGLERMYGLPQEIAAAIARRAEQSGAAVQVAIADNPDAAICAARAFHGVSVIPHGDEAKFLGSLPLALLHPSEELTEVLERWGIRTFQQLAALPPIGLAERLGPEGLKLHRLARGEHERPLVPVTDPLQFEENFELEYPVELLEPLSFVLGRLLHDICTSLITRGLATNELRLRLKLENAPEYTRTLRLPVPMTDQRSFLKLLQLDLAAHPPSAPILHVWLAAEPTPPRHAQSGLFTPIAPEPEKLEITLARIKGIVGEGNVGSPEILDTHRPDAFRMTPFRVQAESASAAGGVSTLHTVALRVFRPPLRAKVAMSAGFPEQVHAEDIHGRVVDYAGPFRTSGDWWTSSPWDRDEWDVSLSDGAVYRVFREKGSWWVAGAYD